MDKQIKLDGSFIPMEVAIKAGLVYGKDIDIPSKEKIMYDYNAKDCEQCNTDSVCCYCKNLACYELEEKLLRKEQECERLKEGLNLILTVQKNCKKCPHQKLDVDVLVCDLDCATAFKKIAKSTLRKCEE